MTVEELIDQLHKCDPEATVVVPFTFDDVEWGRKVAEAVEEYDGNEGLVRSPETPLVGKIVSGATEKAVGIW